MGWFHWLKTRTTRAITALVHCLWKARGFWLDDFPRPFLDRGICGLPANRYSTALCMLMWTWYDYIIWSMCFLYYERTSTCSCFLFSAGHKVPTTIKRYIRRWSKMRIWSFRFGGFPKIGVPLNHPCLFVFFYHKPSNYWGSIVGNPRFSRRYKPTSYWGTPMYGTPQKTIRLSSWVLLGHGMSEAIFVACILYRNPPQIPKIPEDGPKKVAEKSMGTKVYDRYNELVHGDSLFHGLWNLWTNELTSLGPLLQCHPWLQALSGAGRGRAPVVFFVPPWRPGGACGRGESSGGLIYQ